MSKKKKENIDNILDALMIQCMLGKGEIRNKLMDNTQGLDYTQQVEQSEKLYEQEDKFHSMYAVMMLARILKDNQQDLQAVQKYVKEAQRLSDAHGDFDHNMKKGQKKHSKQIDKLKEQINMQQLELKKCRKQLKEQTKTIRILAAYWDLGTMSDDLRKIQKKCSKEMNVQRGNTYCPSNRRYEVIDAEYREAK